MLKAIRECLDTGKAVEAIEAFLKSSEVAVYHQVQVDVQSQHIKSIAGGKKNNSSNEDAMSRRMGQLVKNLRNNANTSMLISSSGCIQSFLFQDEDVNIDENMSILAGCTDHNVIKYFFSLIEFALKMWGVYESKLEGMTKASLVEEAVINARTPAIKISHHNCSVFYEFSKGIGRNASKMNSPAGAKSDNSHAKN